MRVTKGPLHFISLTGLLLLVTLSLTACQSASSDGTVKASTDQAKQVAVLHPVAATFERTITATGSLLAYEEAQISLRVAGRIQSFSVDIGSCVERGAVLASLEPQDLELRVQQSEAALAQAEARLGIAPGGDLRELVPEQTATAKQAKAVLEEAQLRRSRTQELHDQGIVAKADLDTAIAQYQVAEAQHQEAMEEVLNRRAMVVQRRSEVAIARQDLQDAVLRAPFTGCVQQRLASVGQYLNEGVPVLTLVRMDPLRLRLQVAERDAGPVKQNQPVRFFIEGDPTQYSARVSRISPAITPEGRMVTVEAEIKYQPGLRPGAFARADIVTGTGDKALAIPERALIVFAGIEKVRVVEDGKVAEVEVETGRRQTGLIEVLSGLTPESAVVRDPDSVRVGQLAEAGSS